MSLFFEQTILLTVVGFLACVTFGLIRELQTLRHQIARADVAKSSTLPQNSVAPEFSSSDVWSGEHVGRDSLSGATNLLVFISSFCPLCREIPEALKSLITAGVEVQIILICSGKMEDCRFVCERLRHSVRLICDEGGELARTFRIATVPTTVVLDGAVVRVSSHPVSALDFHNLVSTHISQGVTESEPSQYKEATHA